MTKQQQFNLRAYIALAGILAALVLLGALSGCALLMPPNPYSEKVIQALATDDASACVRVNLAGGGAAAAVGPGVIPAGGYGQIGFTIGRAGNSDNQVYVGADGSCQVRSKDKDFQTPAAPPPTLTMQGLGTGAVAPTPGTAAAPEKKEKAHESAPAALPHP
jgi:hypothetical protein